MMKRATLVWLLMAAAAGAGLFLMKYEMRALEDQLAGLNRGIVRNQEALHVLRAEWGYLNRPVRLEKLGRRLLRLEPIRPDQTGRISEIPMRVEKVGVTKAALSSSARTSSPAADRLPPKFAGMKRNK